MTLLEIFALILFPILLVFGIWLVIYGHLYIRRYEARVRKRDAEWMAQNQKHWDAQRARQATAEPGKQQREEH